ncbi:MAG: CPBP family intramembrane metalloprotease [Candidatus Omnitrophica bacterium]|nr:CPBP family intramembrane metalloprotease [Candidatus Omnitrophota bacterium]
MMMIFLVAIVLLIIFSLDIKFLKKQDLALFKTVFQFSRGFMAAMLIVLSFIGVYSYDDKETVILCVVGFLLPFYLLRRERFVRQFNASGVSVPQKLLWASDALGVVIHWFFVFAILDVLSENLFSLVSFPDAELVSLMLLAVLSFGTLIVFIAQASRKFSPEDFWARLGFLKQKKDFIKVLLIPALLGLFFAYVSVAVVLTRAVQPPTPLGDLLDKTQSPLAMALFIFLAIIVAPLVEEIIFRGYFFHVIKEYQGKGAALLSISLVFGMLHMEQYWGDWLAIVMIFLLGFILTALRSWTKTTTASAVAHYVYNTSVVLLPTLLSFPRSF